MKDLFQIPATITNISTKADRTIKIVAETQELSPEQNAILFSLHLKCGWLLFKENAIQIEDVPKEQAVKETKETKTPAQRLRAVLFIYWKQKINNGDFDSFYKGWMEMKIGEIKKQLT